MKKMYVLTVLSLLFIGVSCSSDDSGDSGGNVDEDLLLGEWRLERERDNDTVEPLDETYPSGCDNIWEFTSSRINQSWDFDCDGVEDESDSIAYALDGNRLIVNGQDVGEDGERAEITRLTSSNLTIRLIEPEFEDEPEYIITFDFERL